MGEQTYNITGMTCDHCVKAVTGELRKLPGVSDVKVDLVGGTATVTSSAPIDLSDVAAAVDEAGYELAP
jgi:copper chaperone CopZ